MKLIVKKSSKNDRLVADIPGGHLGLISSQDEDKVTIGEEYEFYLSGYSKRPRVQADGTKTLIVFISLVRDDQLLVRAPNFTCSGSMCVTSTYSSAHGTIYPGRKWPGFVADEVVQEARELHYPSITTNIWVNVSVAGKKYAVGVDAVEDFDFYVKERPEVKRVTDFRQAMYQAWADGLGDDSPMPIRIKNLVERKAKIRKQFNIQSVNYE